MTSTNSKVVQLALCTTALFTASSVAAQSTGDQPTDRNEGTESAGTDQRDSGIIVTASRRPQTLQDTALAVSALSAEQLDATGIADTAGLQVSVPSLQYSTSASSSFIFLRGIGSDVFGSFSDNSVATYVDGIYIPRPTGAVQELFDVERVEVLRGPQATLYGRNATGGAILIATAEPTDYFTAKGEVQLGNYGDQRYRAAISGPIAGDQLTGRLSVVRHHHDGYSTNLADQSDYDDQDYWGVRATLQAKPSDALTITLRGNYSKESGAPGASVAIDPASFPFLAPPFGAGTPFTDDPRASFRNLANENPLETYGVSMKVDWDMGFADLVSNSSYAQYDLGPTILDLDDSLAPLLEYRGEVSTTEFFYQDLTITSKPDSGPLGWLIGATFTREDTGGRLPVLTPGGLSDSITQTDVEAYAIYGQVDFDLTDQLRVSGGLRYSNETREGLSSASFAGSPFFELTNARTWDDVSPKASLEYRPTDSMLIYLSATKGFKSGAFDPSNVIATAEPENIWSYEAGLRTQWFDDVLTFNLTAFHYDYEDLQVFNGVIENAQLLTFLQNAGKATVNGLEIEPTVHVTPDFRIGGSIALLDAQYSDGTVLADIANSSPGFPGVPPSVSFFDVGGNQMAQAPKFTGTIYGDWTLVMANGGSLNLYADYFHQSKRFFTAFEDPTLSADGYDTVNLRATYTFPGENMYVSAYARNVGDTLITSSMQRTPPFGTLVNYAPPRLYGVAIGFSF